MREVRPDEYFEIRVFEENRPPRRMQATAKTTVAEILAQCKITKNEISCYFGAGGLDRPCTFAGRDDTFAKKELVTFPSFRYRYWLRESIPSLWVGYWPREGQRKLGYNWLYSQEEYEAWQASRRPKVAEKLARKRVREAERVAKITKTHVALERAPGRLYGIEEVLSQIRPRASNEASEVDFDGDLIRMNSQRYNVFARSTVCACCGLKGKYFAKERDPRQNAKRYHFNLYGIDAAGEEVMLTKDHIVPRSKGGKDVVSNYQTMCKVCNETKGNSDGLPSSWRTDTTVSWWR